jgi:CBS domain-containing protein
MSFAAKDVMLEGVSLHVEDCGSTLLKKLSGRHHALPVLNDDREVVGVVSEASILKALQEEKTISRSTAGSLMTCGHLEHDSCRSPVTVSPDTLLLEVLRVMLREGLSTMPVVQNRGSSGSSTGRT